MRPADLSDELTRKDAVIADLRSDLTEVLDRAASEAMRANTLESLLVAAQRRIGRQVTALMRRDAQIDVLRAHAAELRNLLAIVSPADLPEVDGDDNGLGASDGDVDSGGVRDQLCGGRVEVDKVNPVHVLYAAGVVTVVWAVLLYTVASAVLS